MTEYGTPHEYDEDAHQRDPTFDSPEGAEPGAGHRGESEIVGVDAVLHSGDRGVEWDQEYRATSLEEWGFQRGGRE